MESFGQSFLQHGANKVKKINLRKLRNHTCLSPLINLICSKFLVILPSSVLFCLQGFNIMEDLIMTMSGRYTEA